MTEILFIVEPDVEGGYNARTVGQDIFTQANDLARLTEMVRDAVRCHFTNDSDRPKLIRPHFVHDEVIAE